MKIKLNKEQFEYLNNIFFKYNEAIKQKVLINEYESLYIIELDEDTADEIRDWASCELPPKGFDSNYELTVEGKILEHLIDKLYVE